jgi:hypothetical protein
MRELLFVCALLFNVVTAPADAAPGPILRTLVAVQMAAMPEAYRTAARELAAASERFVSESLAILRRVAMGRGRD